MHVLVIGGGIGGLCLAQGLKARGISFAVYERDTTPDARLQGYRLNIEPQGSAALHDCLPGPLWDILVATSGDPGAGMGIYTEDLRELMREYSGAGVTDPVRGTHAVSRITLRRLLLAGLDEEVHFGKEFVRYEQHTDGTVTAHFADGTTATGDLLVGADGARSRVRRQLLPHATTADAPGIGIGGKLPLNADTLAWLPPALTQTKNMILPRRDFLFTAAFRGRRTGAERIAGVGEQARSLGVDVEQLLADAKDEDYVMWAYVTHRASGGPLAGPELRAAVHARTSGWHPALRRLVAESADDSIQRFDFSAATRPKPWLAGAVTLLGDAIHHMPPVGGLGGNAALHDASLLCRALAAVHDGTAARTPALSGYERVMLQHGFAAVRTARLYLSLATSRSQALRATARGFFRTCGKIPGLRRAVFENEDNTR
jgi:2-polyprenyl-6-methoxyphenol hydroxylase-like FAD-dependent oxidoreductase